MFINFSNHSCNTWSAEQLAAAEFYGEVLDLPFPDVPAEVDEAWINAAADALCREISERHPAAVMVQGEMSLAFAVASRLLKSGITAVCATSKRVCKTITNADGSVERQSVFRFVGFRKYTL